MRKQLFETLIVLGIVFVFLKTIFAQSSSKTTYYCIQLSSFKDKTLSLKEFEKVKTFPHARVEKIGKFYILRVGLETNKDKLVPILRKIKTRFKDAFVCTCYYIPQRIIWPRPKMTSLALKFHLKRKIVKKGFKKRLPTVSPEQSKETKPIPKKEMKKVIKPRVKRMPFQVIPPALPRIPQGALGVIPKPRVIIFPVSNFSQAETIPEHKIIKYWASFFEKRGFEALLPEDIKKFLYARRIREFYCLSSTLAQELGRRYKARAVILSWVDSYQPSIPEIGIGVRVIDTRNGSILWTNYIILRGDDFRSWFGLGEVKDEQRLMDIALRKILKTFPVAFKAQEQIPNVRTDVGTSYLLEDFSLMPKVVKGKSTVKIAVRLIASDEMCKRVAVFIGNKEAFLHKSSSLWKGEISAPQREGFYFSKIKIWDYKGLIHFINTGVVLTVDNTPPKLKISVENPIFSPNMDGIKDSVIFFPFLLEPDKIKKWVFLIYNEKGRLIRSYEGVGDLPTAWAWHGEDNEHGNVSDGTYFFRCVAEDEAGNVAATNPIKIIVDKTPPHLEFSFISNNPQDNKGVLKIKCLDENEINDWSLSIVDKKGRLLKFVAGSKNLPDTLTLKLPQPAKEYFVVSEVRDVAGNLSKLKIPLFAKGVFKTKSPKEEVKKRHEEWNYDF